MEIAVLGPASRPSPLNRSIDDSEHVPGVIVPNVDARPADGRLFELAGVCQKVFFKPPGNSRWDCYLRRIVSRSGLNQVIRSLFFEMHHADGVEKLPLQAITANQLR